MIRTVAIVEMPRSIRARCSYQSEWRSPWKPDAVRRNVTVTRWPLWIRALKGRTGVYLIRDATTKALLYVGRGRTDLKASVVRHFYAWGDDPRGPHRRVLFDRDLVEVKVYIVRSEWVLATEADLIAICGPTLNDRSESAHATVTRDPGEDNDEGGLWGDFDDGSTPF